MIKEEDQIIIIRAIFAGAVRDKDGYCGCPECGSRNLTHDGYALDDGYLKCNDCEYYISGGDARQLISRWNSESRTSFQLKIIFVEPCFN